MRLFRGFVTPAGRSGLVTPGKQRAFEFPARIGLVTCWRLAT